MSRWFLVLVATAIAVVSAMSFEPPGPEKRHAAIGATNGLPLALRRALALDDSFQPVPVSNPGLRRNRQ